MDPPAGPYRKFFFPSTPPDMLSATVVNVFQQVFAWHMDLGSGYIQHAYIAATPIITRYNGEKQCLKINWHYDCSKLVRCFLRARVTCATCKLLQEQPKLSARVQISNPSLNDWGHLLFGCPCPSFEMSAVHQFNSQNTESKQIWMFDDVCMMWCSYM